MMRLRGSLRARGLPDAAAVTRLPDGRRTTYVGMVITRQRPGTASGVTFMTLEDESGFVNVVVWRKVYDRYRLLVKAEPFLGVSGKLQVEQNVVHLIAEKLWVPRVEEDLPKTRSRDFH